ncbi:MAG: diacylglycerol kinase family protein [Cyclobacteriaceae bacterium]
MTSDKFSMKKRLQSFSHAFRGLRLLVKETHNARIHIFTAVMVVFCGVFFEITLGEWLTLIILITLVLAAELFNSALEYLCDAVTTEFHPAIKNAKDMAAGAVLVMSIGAAIAGLLIFLPYLINYIE